jgi:hypothetical protein
MEQKRTAQTSSPSFIKQLILPDTKIKLKALFHNIQPSRKELIALSLLLLWTLTAIALGLYVGSLLLPLIVNTLIPLLALTMSPWLAIFFGVITALALMLFTIALLAPHVLLLQISAPFLKLAQYMTESDFIFNGKHLKFNRGLFLFSIAGGLAGIGLGIYLATLITPLLITALASMLPYGIAVFIGIIASLGLIVATAHLLTQPLIILSNLRDAARLVFQFIERRRYTLNALYLGSLILGAGLGVYASVYLAPLIINTLVALSISQGVAVFTAIAVSFALINLVAWAASSLVATLNFADELVINFGRENLLEKPEVLRALDIMLLVIDPAMHLFKKDPEDALTKDKDAESSPRRQSTY